MIYINGRFLTQKMTGVQRYGYEIAKVLKRQQGDNIRVLCPANILLFEEAKELDALVIGKHTGHIWEQWDLPRYLRRRDSGVLLNFANTAPVMCQNKISTLHDITFIRHPDTFSWKFRTWYRVLIPLVLKSSKRIVTVSEFSKKEISDQYQVPANKISVIYSAVSEKFHKSAAESGEREKFFICVSSVKKNKNFTSILKAFQLTENRLPEYRLYVIGDMHSSSFNNMDLTEFNRDCRIKFLGRISDDELIHYYSMAAGFVFPSLYEGFGMPPLEAQACGCPVIVSGESSLPEVFRDSALYCNAYDVEDISNKIVVIAQDSHLCRELQEKAACNIKRFSFDLSAKLFSQIVDQLVI